jgi:hypothetical protein
MKADYVHKDTLTATDYVELNKNNELLMSYNQALLKENQELKKMVELYSKSLYNAELTKCKEVIDKAIEYIKSYKIDYSPYELSDYNVRQILEILKGDSNE